ncbi:hypothetical protein Agub_g5029 [Astrephomene gubernaculifera]|uniref:Uncharacterized protein n=1 Tax=Astrephomene gubernaculifera TaxID=47775 RepID=A0AAD3DNM8_9CHLO|nr:hypothetical protein Agub_g5029 [Astrephomene gubernaculifera]
MDGGGHKRKFPYHSEVAGFEVKQRRPGCNPGTEYNDPLVFQQPSYDYDTPVTSTDFTRWTPDEIKAFLDRRGGDYDDCPTFEQLVERAVEVEINTGPAVRPGQEEGQGGGPATAAAGAAAGGPGAAGDELEEWERPDFAQQLEQQAAAAAGATRPVAPPPVPVTAVPHYLQQSGYAGSRFGPPRGSSTAGGTYGTSTSYASTAADGDAGVRSSPSSSSTYGMSSYRNMPPPPSLNAVPPPRSYGGSGPGRGGFGGGGGGGMYGGGAAVPPPAPQQQQAGMSASAAAAAIAAAQAIAARLAAQAPGPGQPGQYPPPPPPPM